jgi:hypothetical protein
VLWDVPLGIKRSPNIIRPLKSRRMRWVGYVAQIGEKRKVYKVLVGKRPLRRQRHRWEHGIRMDVGEIGCGGSSIDSG